MYVDKATNLVPIGRELRQAVRVAMTSPFRFERHERFAMQKLLQSGQARDLAEGVYVEAARRALRRCATPMRIPGQLFRAARAG